MTVVRIGIVGGGLMGRELAAAIGRWPALSDHPIQPRLEAVCDTVMCDRWAYSSQRMMLRLQLFELRKREVNHG